jgi:hypothetical protein
MTQFKVATALVLAFAIAATGAGLILSQSSAAPDPLGGVLGLLDAVTLRIRDT